MSKSKNLSIASPTPPEKFDLLPTEIQLTLFFFLTTTDLESLTYVNKAFLALSHLIWAEKLKKEFNYPLTSLSRSKFFYQKLTIEAALQKERELFVACLKLISLHGLKFTAELNNIPLYWHKLRKKIIYKESNQAVLISINNSIDRILSRLPNMLNEDELSQVKEGLMQVEKQANLLFDTLLSSPLAVNGLERGLYLLCTLNAHQALGIILKKTKELTLDLAPLFACAIASLNLDTMKKIIECGFNIHKKIKVNNLNQPFLNIDLPTNWLTFTVLSFDEMVFPLMRTYPDTKKITSPGIYKLKNIVRFLLEFEFDGDEIIAYDEQNNAITLRLICQDALDEIKNSTLNNAFRSIVKDIFSLVLNAMPAVKNIETHNNSCTLF